MANVAQDQAIGATANTSAAASGLESMRQSGEEFIAEDERTDAAQVSALVSEAGVKKHG